MQKTNFKPCIYKAYFALALGVLLFLSACTSSELKELEEAASIIQLQTGREVNRSVRDKDVVLGKPVHAEMRIDYEPINNYTMKEVYDEIVAILEKNNWEGEECNGCNYDAFSASLQQDHRYIPLSATVLVDSDKNLVRIYLKNRNR